MSNKLCVSIHVVCVMFGKMNLKFHLLVYLTDDLFEIE